MESLLLPLSEPSIPIPLLCFTDLEKQKQEAIATNERLGTEVETVLNVIEDPSVAASLKQDKAQNLQWLEENYKVNVKK